MFRITNYKSCLKQLVSGVSGLVIGVSSLVLPVPAISEQVIEEVVVTARKRTESQQDVPIAISAFGASELEDRGIESIEEIARLTPNTTINETSGLVAGAVQVFVRGIGNDPGFDQGVGIYVDDVYLNRTTGALLEVYDIERIEVLKGPQGHLYGRNAIGGAIKYVSAEPGNERRIFVEGKVGTDSLRRYKVGISGALMEDKLLGSLAVSGTEMDGYQTNVFNGDEYADQDKLAYRGSLIWNVSDSFRVKLIGDQFKDRSNPYVPTRVAVNQGGSAGLGAAQAILSTANMFCPPAQCAYLAPGEMLDAQLFADEDTVNTGFVGPGGFDEFRITTRNYAMTLDWDLSESWAVKSVTAQRKLRNNTPFDFDGSSQIFINTLQRIETEDFSQELQVNYSGNRVNAVFGVYYLDGDYAAQISTTQTPLLRFFTSHVKETDSDDRTLKSISYYANVDWDISDVWQLSVGGRYTTDEKDIDQIANVTLTQHVAAFVTIPDLARLPLALNSFGTTLFPNLPGGLFRAFLPHRNRGEMTAPIIARGNTETVQVYPENKIGEDEWSEFTPSVKLSFRPSDNTMIYGGAATGFKSGNFTFSGPDFMAPAYDPETVTTYSLGIKSTLLGGSLRINAEAFLNDYEDKQVTVIALEGGRLIQQNENVGEVEISGAEVEILWLPPVDGLAINLNVGYLDTEIDTLIDQLPGTMTLGNVADDRALGYAPELTWQARVQYTASLGDAGSLTFAVDANYRDEMYTDSPIDLTNPFLLQAQSDDRTITNAFVTWRSANQKWRVSLEGKNLTDERVLENTFNVSNFILGGYNRSRTWGLTVGYHSN